MNAAESHSPTGYLWAAGLFLVAVCIVIGLRSASPNAESATVEASAAAARVALAGEDIRSQMGENYTTPEPPGHVLLVHPDLGIRPMEGPQTPYPVALLIEAAEVQTAATSKRLQVLDVRRWQEYADRHIEGAVHIDLYDWLAAFTLRQSATVWERKIGSLGLDPTRPVVVCDDGLAVDGACAWWILRYWGFNDVRLLNGGWPSWLFLGARQDNALPRIAIRTVDLRPSADMTSSRNEVQRFLATGRGQVIESFIPSVGGDARGPSRAAAGMKKLNWLEVFDSSQSKFASADQVARQLASARIVVDRPIVVYGQSLRETAPLAFALEVMGGRDVRAYWPGWDQ